MGAIVLFLIKTAARPDWGMLCVLLPIMSSACWGMLWKAWERGRRDEHDRLRKEWYDRGRGVKIEGDPVILENGDKRDLGD
jgi:hypothetical protein